VDTKAADGPIARMDDGICESFGQRLRTLRSKTGLSQEAFADMCGLDRTYISGIERGRRNPSLRNLAKIARALNLSISELFKGVK
jgi:transcriptional regulator with XRE-family HTH domain